MIIDVAERIAEVKAITKTWAEENGYVAPDKATEAEISQVGRNLQRILNTSNFGCQQRNVAAILSALTGDKIVAGDGGRIDYSNPPTGFPLNLALVAVNSAPENDRNRVGIVARTSANGNAGLRQSSGNLAQQHYSRESMRPATDEEIDQYFREFFGLEQNPLDTAGIEETEHPF